MAIKQTVYLVDDFSSNSVELYGNLYGNITFFDYADFHVERHWDINSDGVMDPFASELFADYGPAFRQVNYDSSLEWSSAIDNDYYTEWTLDNHDDHGPGYYKDSHTHYGIDSSSDSEIKHGDWVLKAFYDQLENPSAVEVILVDIDTDSQKIALFSDTSSLYSSAIVPTFHNITERFLNTYYYQVGTTYTPTVLSISIAGFPTTVSEASFLNFLIANNVLVVQSAPNVQNGDYSWGQTHPEVINVGAWNVNSSNEFLGGSTPVLDSIDIYANGLVERFGWESGSKFGTSFATPRVSAEIVNLLQGNIDSLNQLNYAQLLASVNLISSDVYVEVNGVWQLNPLLILNDDMSNGLAPTEVPNGTGIVGMVVTDAAFAPTNNLPTGSVSISGTAVQGQILTASNTLADIDGLVTITYQWRSNGTNISSATDSTYTLTQADVGRAITVVASYTDLFGNAESVASGASASVANVNDAATGAVSISGTARQGQVLTASNTLADVDGLGTIAYQWRSNGTNIISATGSTYTLTQAEVGKSITVVASYTDQLGSVESVASDLTRSVEAILSATYTVPVSAIDSIGLSPDGQYLLIKVAGVTQSVPVGSSLSFNGSIVTTSDLTSSITPQPVFQSSGGSNGYALPEAFTGPTSLNLDYQLIENGYNAVVIGGATNDFIKVASTDSLGKAVDGGAGDDVIDGGVGSTFISGGTGSDTIFLDGRAPGVSWSTVTDFTFGQDKATIWGWKAGVSKVSTLFTDFNTGGAAGYTGLTLHFENLLPDGAGAGQKNSNFNSITLSGRTLADLGASSLEDLNAQITAGTNSHLIVGQTVDAFGEHGYLFLS